MSDFISDPNDDAILLNLDDDADSRADAELLGLDGDPDAELLDLN